MSNQIRQRHILKIFSGPHLGAEILLGDGVHVIGSDDSADIILHDRLIVSRHASIVISDDRVDCKSEDNANLLLEGRPCKEAALSPYQIFTLGNTHLAIGPADSPWPAMEFSDFTLLPSTPSASKPLDADAMDARQLTREDRSGCILARWRQYRWYGAAAGVALVFLTVACYGLFADSSPLKFVPLEIDAVERILAEAVNTHAPGAIAKATQEAEQICITGYVDTIEHHRSLKHALSELCPSVHVRLCSSEQLVRAVSQVLKASHLKLGVAKGKPGEVVIRGMMRNRERLDAAIQRVKMDVPTIRQLTSLVCILQGAPESSPEEKMPLDSQQTAFAKEPQNAPPSIAFAIQGINQGVYQWVVLPDGNRVFRGATLSNGYCVKAITPQGLVLSKDIGHECAKPVLLTNGF